MKQTKYYLVLILSETVFFYVSIEKKTKLEFVIILDVFFLDVRIDN